MAANMWAVVYEVTHVKELCSNSLSYLACNEWENGLIFHS